MRACFPAPLLADLLAAFPPHPVLRLNVPGPVSHRGNAAEVFENVPLARLRFDAQKVHFGGNAGAVKNPAVVSGDDAVQVGLAFEEWVETPACREIKQTTRGAVRFDRGAGQEIVRQGIGVVEPNMPPYRQLRIDRPAEQCGDDLHGSGFHAYTRPMP